MESKEASRRVRFFDNILRGSSSLLSLLMTDVIYCCLRCFSEADSPEGGDRA